MEHLPKRTSLVHETAVTLKQWISAGVLSEALPGELQLKSRLGVGRNTLRLALKMLANQGWVSAAAKGQHRRVRTGHRPPDGETAGALLPVTFISPYPIVLRVTLLKLEELRLRLAEQGRGLRFISPAIFRLKHPERHLDRLVREHPSSAWVLYSMGEAIQQWFDQKAIPTLIFGSPFPGVKLPFVVPNWETAAFHAGVQLVRQGHRVIAIMEQYARFPGLLAAERGLQQALETAPDGKGKGRVVVLKDDLTGASVARAMESAFAMKNRPTALVLTRALQVLTALSWFVSRGIRVPADVSLVSLADDSWFTEFQPPIAYYRSDAKVMGHRIAERVIELVTNGQVDRKSIRIPMEFIAGATIGPTPHS
ncbi:MAG: transcriptional regulator [Pedosphaera sp.]|nr:transcriptional regulator [Pedosphaera sp.]